MNITIPHGRRTGEMKVPSSKSQAHRLLICSALAKTGSVIRCDGFSKDIEATVNCLNALGAKITKEEPGVLRVSPVRAECSVCPVRTDSHGRSIGEGSVGNGTDLNSCEVLPDMSGPVHLSCAAQTDMSGSVHRSCAAQTDSSGSVHRSCVDSSGTVHGSQVASSETAHLYCGESGSTLRFLIPVCGALGADAVFHMEGRLSERPIDELEKACSAHGMTFERSGNELHVSGQLTAGTYSVDGRISSQFITGLLFALPMLDGSSVLNITGGLESSAYIRMTEDALVKSGIRFTKTGNCLSENGSTFTENGSSFSRTGNNYRIEGNQTYSAPGTIDVECDWSGAAFPLCMGAFSKNGITVRGLNTGSVQGDMKILELISVFGAEVTVNGSAVTVRRKELHGTDIDAAEIPDLIPVVCVVAAVSEGETRITGAARLRLKESDRIKSTASMINALGGEAYETEDGLIIKGKQSLSGGLVDSFGDHRIAMSAAAAAAVCDHDVTITAPECTDKSFPGFFERFSELEAEK